MVKFTVVEWFSAPLVPVIKIWKVPCFCWLGTVKDMLVFPDPVTVAGAKVAVSGEGNPETLKLTVPENPAWPMIVIGSEPVWPRFTVKIFEDEIEKSPVPCAFTTSVTVVLCNRAPLDPVIVKVYVPAGVVVPVVTESAARPDPLIELGLMLAIGPPTTTGDTLTLKFTKPVNPATEPTLTW
jgi:hypothetical protein